MRFLLAASDLVRWPFERAAWSIERGVVWPLQRRFVGQRLPGHSVGAATLAVIAAGAVGVAVLVLPGGNEAPPEQTAEPARVAVVTPEPQPQDEGRQEPSLQGVPPHFGVGKGVGVSNGDSGETGAGGSASSPTGSRTGAPAGAEASTSQEEAATASSSSEPVVPAGPAAMDVARRFSEAFVFYEVGKRPAQAKAVFDETATEELAKALEERPPRLPSDAKVPKAKVVNLVPGPRFGRQYTVSVSLLRVGVTSELRLTLEKEKDGEWSIAQILG